MTGQPDKRRVTAKAIGDILRYARNAAECNHEHGPSDALAGHLRDIRAAADRALRLCESAGGET